MKYLQPESVDRRGEPPLRVVEIETFYPHDEMTNVEKKALDQLTEAFFFIAISLCVQSDHSVIQNANGVPPLEWQPPVPPMSFQVIAESAHPPLKIA